MFMQYAQMFVALRQDTSLGIPHLRRDCVKPTINAFAFLNATSELSSLPRYRVIRPTKPFSRNYPLPKNNEKKKRIKEAIGSLAVESAFEDGNMTNNGTIDGYRETNREKIADLQQSSMDVGDEKLSPIGIRTSNNNINNVSVNMEQPTSVPKKFPKFLRMRKWESL